MGTLPRHTAGKAAVHCAQYTQAVSHAGRLSNTPTQYNAKQYDAKQYGTK